MAKVLVDLRELLLGLGGGIFIGVVLLGQFIVGLLDLFGVCRPRNSQYFWISRERTVEILLGLFGSAEVHVSIGQFCQINHS